LFISQALGHFEAINIGMGYANVLRVRSCVTAEGMRVAVDSSGYTAQQRFLQFGIGVRVVAERPKFVLAIPTLSAADERRNDNAIALLDLAHLWPCLDDLAHEFVADDIAFPHGRDVPVNEVQVGATCRRGSNFQDHVMGIDDGRIRDCFYLEFINSIPAERSHMNS
jgi:hypothetical protein